MAEAIPMPDLTKQRIKQLIEEVCNPEMRPQWRDVKLKLLGETVWNSPRRGKELAGFAMHELFETYERSLTNGNNATMVEVEFALQHVVMYREKTTPQQEELLAHSSLLEDVLMALASPDENERRDCRKKALNALQHYPTAA